MVTAWAKQKWGDKIAPNGKYVWENFVDWFLDSKIVDSNGSPLRLYHGTTSEVKEFDLSLAGQSATQL